MENLSLAGAIALLKLNRIDGDLFDEIFDNHIGQELKSLTGGNDQLHDDACFEISRQLKIGNLEIRNNILCTIA